MTQTVVLASLAAIPTSALAAGMVGALGIGLHGLLKPARRHRSSPTPLPPVRLEPDPGDAVVYAAMCDEGAAPIDAAAEVVNAWAGRPRSAWRTLAHRLAQQSVEQREASVSARFILEGILAHQAATTDAWFVRDMADTAWFSAPADGVMLTDEQERLAREALADAALAILVRPWLPVRDYAALTVFRVA